MKKQYTLNVNEKHEKSSGGTYTAILAALNFWVLPFYLNVWQFFPPPPLSH